MKNFAIIDNIEVKFDDGFSTITGETGAGKSLIIDAIGVLLGNKTSSTMVRNGQTKAIIEGVFTNLSTKTSQLLDDLGIKHQNAIIIRREIGLNGKTNSKINNKTITINQLADIGYTIADIHTQNDTKKLFDEKNYLSFIDDQETLKLLNEYLFLRSYYQDLFKKYENIQNEISNYQKDQEFLTYQYQKLVNANLKKSELEKLENELIIMNNYEIIFQNLQKIKKLFNDHNINEQLYLIYSTLEKLSFYDSKYKEDVSTVNNSYFELKEIEQKISEKLNNIEFDNNYFNQVNERIKFLNNLCVENHRNIDDLILYKDQLKEKITMLEDSSFYIDEIKKKLDQAYEQTKKKANQLTLKRIENAKNLTNDIKESLNDLMLEKVRIEIKFTSLLKEKYSLTSFPKNGVDKISILISFNPGEPLKDLSKIASGGEMSRVMLALKTHLLKNLELSTIIFDEIDSGISGETAYQVAKKLKLISQYSQVLAITHLPIVASCAANQFYIYKEFDESSTKTLIKKLQYNERIEVLSKLISPIDQSEYSKVIAKQMLNNN